MASQQEFSTNTGLSATPEFENSGDKAPLWADALRIRNAIRVLQAAIDGIPGGGGSVVNANPGPLELGQVVVGGGLQFVHTIVDPQVAGQVLTSNGPGTDPTWNPSGGGLTIEEVDGSPSVAATKLVLPNGTLSVVGTVATYTPAGAGASRNVVSVITPVAGVCTVDYSLGDYFTILMNTTPMNLAFINLPASPVGITLYIRIVQSAVGLLVFSWPASFKWDEGVPSNIGVAANAINDLIITSINQGTTWRAQLGRNIA